MAFAKQKNFYDKVLEVSEDLMTLPVFVNGLQKVYFTMGANFKPANILNYIWFEGNIMMTGIKYDIEKQKYRIYKRLEDKTRFKERLDYCKEEIVQEYTKQEFFDLIEELKNKKLNKENKKAKKENKIMLENTNTNVNVATPVNEATPAPAIDVPAIDVPATPAETASVPAGATPITSVADFLKMVHDKNHGGLSDGKIKVSLDEIKTRLGGKIKIMQLEKTSNEGRNFYLVQIDEGAYMYSFKMMTTILQKWEDACGGLDNLNKMLAQANIIGVITDGEYNGKRYTRFDIE